MQLTKNQSRLAAFYQPQKPLPKRSPEEGPEVLAPAGNFTKLKAAILYGCDAAYMAGHRFGLRAFADNFSLEDIASAVDYAHRHGVRIYLTVNSLLRTAELDAVATFVQEISSVGVDAVIVSDPGVFRVVRRVAPDLEIHMSTQMSISNAEACLLWHELGASRVVVARELSLKDIEQMRKALPPALSIEAFVHGAMCMAWSGRCLLSKEATGRDANRGACVQPCRWKYQVTEVGQMSSSGDSTTWSVETDEMGSYLFSSKDLCMIDHLGELIEAGVDSLKIEGRMKSEYYVAVVTKMYREAVDDYLAGVVDEKRQAERREALNWMVHRTYDTGFYYDHPTTDAKVDTKTSYNNAATVVAVVEKQVGQQLYCEQRNKLVVGDHLDCFQPHEETLQLTVTELQNESGEAVLACPHPKQKFVLIVPEQIRIEAGSYLRRKGVKYGEEQASTDHP